MKFLSDGPDIPAELIAAQEKGNVIFICGAGVSKMVGLPLFGELVQKVYDHLGEDWKPHPAEHAGMAPDGRLAGQYDRVLRRLEVRLAATNGGSGHGMREHIRQAIREALTPSEDADLKNHVALLELSRDNDSSIRLLTTNFDTLFERAWYETRHIKLPSHAGAALPQPKTATCKGVLHLHGRLEDKKLSLAETDLILTSAEFGEAYLRSGWSSRYVYDLTRAYTVVLVGYKADDPPMRYVLEALEADRERYPDLQHVYAFADSAPDQHQIEAALWEAKGVEPIIYTVANHDHSPLYRTIQEWRRYAADPTHWRREQLRTLLEKHPSAHDANGLQRCVDLLSHGDSTQLLGELAPPAAWLSVLDEHRVFNNPHNINASAARWIDAQYNNPDLIRACAGRTGLVDEQTKSLVRYRLGDKACDISPVRRKAWELILGSLSARRDMRDHDEWHQAEQSISRNDTGFACRQIIGKILQPRLRVHGVIHWRGEREDEETTESLYSLLRLDFKAKNYPTATAILSAWPKQSEQEISLFQTLSRIFSEALEEARDAGFAASWDRSDHDVPSVAEHTQNTYRSGFYPIVRVQADLWQRIVPHEHEWAKRQAFDWLRSSFTLPKRLALFAMTDPTFTPQEVANTVLDLDDYDFWISGAQVELMRLFLSRWVSLYGADRQRIEERLCAGVPRKLFDESAPDDEKWASIHDNSIFKRLARFRAQGLVLTTRSRALFDEITGRHPLWAPSAADRDDFHSWHEMHYGPMGQPGQLGPVPDDELVREAIRLQSEHAYEQGDIWRVFCAAEPERALNGLTHEARKDRWDHTAWRTFLLEVPKDASSTIYSHLIDHLLSMPEEPLRHILRSVSYWLQEQHRGAAHQLDEHQFLALWDRLAQLTYSDVPAMSETEDGENMLEHSLNWPGGILAEILLKELSKTKVGTDEGFPTDIEARLTRVATATGRQGLAARIRLIRALPYLYAVAPVWTSTKLLPHLSFDSLDAPVLWRSYARNGQISSAPLFNKIKSSMFEACVRPEISDDEIGELVTELLGIVLGRQLRGDTGYQLDPAELRTVLTAGSGATRHAASGNLWKNMDDANGDPQDKAQRWRSLVGPAFKAIWPLGGHLRSTNVSINLVHMAMACDSAFPDAVDQIVDVLVPYELVYLEQSLGLKEVHRRLLVDHPRALLKMLNAIIDPKRYSVPADLADVLATCLRADSTVEVDETYQRLYGFRRRRGA